jgi:2-succinyl-6-hydroxy-2,4-cyclohexadiene-1-carboxylate synthase
VLNVRIFGEGSPVVALHGWTLTGQQFADASDRLSNHVGRSVVAPDLPGHGESAAEPATVNAVVASIATTLTDFETPVPLLGYSQGGRMALLSTLDVQASVSCLVLISATAGIRDPIDRSERKRRDREFADHIRQTELTDFMDDWTTRPLTSTGHLSEDRQSGDRAIRLSNTAEGLATAIEGYGQGVQPDVWDRLVELALPTLVIAGERDQIYTSIAKDMSDAIEDADLVVIPDAGHNPMAEAPDQTWDTVSSFLDRNG